ncbi:MAG: NADH-quinone oxidoreductase subunit A [Candidatus Nealsonbacteria bacterium]|nr:NADH-quinone oxidoreductase subunit A [Candidatus Nealsonbacteria bacterium]
MTPTSIVAYLALFAAVGFVFLFVALLLGRFLRANTPSDEKLEPYECGEPPVGSAFVQFDLRFYVVALVFIIFEVEVAFFFPWATVMGKSVQLKGAAATWLAIENQPAPSSDAAKEEREKEKQEAKKKAEKTLAELVGAREAQVHDAEADAETAGQAFKSTKERADSLALASMADMGVFFGVLLVGFAYVWWRGDLNWVRAVGRPAGGGEI